MVQPHGTTKCCCCSLPISEVCFRVICIDSYPSVETECENAIKVEAVVTKVAWGSAVAVGGIITIYDPRHVHFDIGIETLIGAEGTAVYYNMPAVSDAGIIVPPCPESGLLEDYGGTGCRWVVTGIKPCSSRTRDEVMFRVLANAPPLRTDANGYDEFDYGLRVLAEIIEVPCSNTDFALWDRIIVWDLNFDTFNLPIPVLLGAIGTAKRVVDPLPFVDPYCEEYEPDGCRWIVTDFTCVEELYICD